MIQVIRNRIPQEEFDYLALMDALKGYAQPRDKITKLLKQGVIVRVKKGIYVFGEELARRPWSREVLANMIYGPSYVSLEYALQYYGLTPEAVQTVTSVTCGRGRRFFTPLGLFTYRMIPLAAYAFGEDRIELEGSRSFLIAVPEKALADKVVSARGVTLRSNKQMSEYLFADLRVDSEALRDLNYERFEELAERYRSKKVRVLAKLVKRLKEEPEYE